MISSDQELSPFVKFDAETWSTFKHSQDKMTIKEEDLKKLVAFNDKISLEEVNRIYMPLKFIAHVFYFKA